MRVFGIRARYLLVPIAVAVWYFRKRPLGRPGGRSAAAPGDKTPLGALLDRMSRTAGAPPAPPASPAPPQIASRPAPAATKTAPAPAKAAPAKTAPASAKAAPTTTAPAPAKAAPAKTEPARTVPAAATPKAEPAPQRVAAAVPDGPYGPGSATAAGDGSAPSPEFTIKGNASSMLYHTAASPYYGRTKAEVWFRTEEDARNAGFTAWAPRKRK